MARTFQVESGLPRATPASDLDCDALAQLSFLVHNALAEIAGEHELSIVQTRLLGILRDREPSMIELGRHLGLDKSSVTGLVDRAQRRGLVTRTVSATDRRSYQVSSRRPGGSSPTGSKPSSPRGSGTSWPRCRRPNSTG